MAVPAATTAISLAKIRDEIENNNYNHSLYGYTSSSTSLKDISDGSIDTINTANASADRPDGSAPHAMSEFFSYDHDKVSTNPVLSYVGGKRSFYIVEAVEGSDSEARIYIWCYRTGTTIKVYARMQGNGDSGGDSADAGYFTGLNSGTETTLTGETDFHNVNFQFAQITNVDSGYKVGFSDAAVSGQGNQHSGTGSVHTINMDAGTNPTTAVRTTFWTASAGNTTQNTPPTTINAVRYTSEALTDDSDYGYDRVTLHFKHATLADFDVVVDVSTEAEGVLVDEGEEDCPQCCIHESMLIATEEDMKSIHDIKIGDKVISYNFETESNELVEVEDLITIERDVDYKVNNLILTEDHPVYLNTGKKASINPEATLLNYKQEVDQIQIGDIMVKLDGTEEVIQSIEKYEGTHLNYAIKTKHNNFYADGILVDSVILEKK